MSDSAAKGKGTKKTTVTALSTPQPATPEQLLLSAADAGNLAQVRKLVEDDKANVQSLDKFGCTALQKAARGGFAKVVEYLLDHGAGADGPRTKMGFTPLHSAVLGGSFDSVQTLIVHGANVMLKDNFGRTALDVAKENRMTDILKILEDAMAVERENEKRQNCLSLLAAAAEGDVARVTALLALTNININFQDGTKRSALHHAAKVGHEKIVEGLLRAGCQLDLQDEDGKTPFDLALDAGKVMVAATIKKKSKDDRRKALSAELVEASEANDAQRVEKLLSDGADVHKRDNSDMTPLHRACEKGALAAAEALIRGGADVNSASYDDWRPLHFAVAGNFLDLVCLLCDKEADLTAKTKQGQTPYDLAVAKSLGPIADTLAQRSMQELWRKTQAANAQLIRAAADGNLAGVKQCLKDGANVNHAQDATRWTALFMAAAYGHPEVVTFLIRNGANIQAVDNENLTPLQVANQYEKAECAAAIKQEIEDLKKRQHEALCSKLITSAQAGDMDQVKRYLQLGADVNHVDSLGYTALARAVEGGQTQVALHLLSVKADATIKNKSGMTPFLLAAKAQNSQMIARLADRDGVKQKLHEAITRDGWTALHIAANIGSIRVCRQLLLLGLDVFQRDNFGRTPYDLVLTQQNKELEQIFSSWVSNPQRKGSPPPDSPVKGGSGGSGGSADFPDDPDLPVPPTQP